MKIFCDVVHDHVRAKRLSGGSGTTMGGRVLARREREVVAYMWEA